MKKYYFSENIKFSKQQQKSCIFDLSKIKLNIIRTE